jgi:hypothetical protein
MPNYNKHIGLEDLPTKPVDVPAWFNKLLKILARQSPTIERQAYQNLAEYAPLYMWDDGKADLADDWQPPFAIAITSTTHNYQAILPIQHAGLLINDTWTWNEGVFLYTRIGTNTLSETPGEMSYPSAITISPTEILLLPPCISEFRRWISSNKDGPQKCTILRTTYDFSEHGGSGTIGLGVYLPQNVVVTRAYYYVVTTLTSSSDSAVVSITIPGDDSDGIVAPIAINDASNPWDDGWHETIQDGDAGNFSNRITYHEGREVSLKIQTESLTAGKLILFCEYSLFEGSA